MSLIARQDNKKNACPGCTGPILRGQKIKGERGRWQHADCADLTIYAVPEPGGAGKRTFKDPNAPMTAEQLAFIGELFDERQVTQGEASVIIDHLKSRPRKKASAGDELAGNLRSVA